MQTFRITYITVEHCLKYPGYKSIYPIWNIELDPGVYVHPASIRQI